MPIQVLEAKWWKTAAFLAYRATTSSKGAIATTSCLRGPSPQRREAPRRTITTAATHARWKMGRRRASAATHEKKASPLMGVRACK